MANSNFGIQRREFASHSLLKFFAHLLSTSFFIENYLFLKKGRNHDQLEFRYQTRIRYPLSNFQHYLAFSRELFILKKERFLKFEFRYPTTRIRVRSPFQIFSTIQLFHENYSFLKKTGSRQIRISVSNDENSRPIPF